MMEKHTDWTTKLAPTAQVSNPTYQIFVHDISLSFDPGIAEYIKELQRANEIYLQGIRIQKAVWVKKKLDPKKIAGSLILWLEQAEVAEKAITKEIMWKCDLNTMEIFRSGFGPCSASTAKDMDIS